MHVASVFIGSNDDGLPEIQHLDKECGGNEFGDMYHMLTPERLL